MAEYRWTLDGDQLETMRSGLSRVSPRIRAELWWWMGQRGKPCPGMPPNLEGLEPSIEQILDHIRNNDSPGCARSDYWLVQFVISTAKDSSTDRVLAAKSGDDNIAMRLALNDIDLPEGWENSLVGAAVIAVGSAER